MRTTPKFLERLNVRRSTRNQRSIHSLGTYLPAVLALFGGLMGGVVGNAMLESGKSADSLRRFVLVDLYKPYDERARKCLGMRSDLSNSYAKASLVFSAAIAGIDVLGKQPLEGTGSSSKDMLSAMDKLLNELKSVGDAEASLRACKTDLIIQTDMMSIATAQTEKSGQILAAHGEQVAAIERKYAGAQLPTMSKLFSDSQNEISKLILGTQGALNGDAVKTISLMAKGRKVLAEFRTLLDNRTAFHVEMAAAEASLSRQLGTFYFQVLSEQYAKGVWRLMLDDLKNWWKAI